MKRIFTLSLIAVIFYACSTPTVHTIRKTAQESPYSNILVLYVNNNFETFRFDAEAYNLFTRGYISDATKQYERRQMENYLYEKISPYCTTIKSVDVLSPNNCSYAYFTKISDSLQIDAVLLVALNKSTSKTYRASTSNYNSSAGDYKVYDATFDTYLLARNNKQPIWMSRTDMKNKNAYRGRPGIKRKFAEVITKALQKEGYLQAP